MCIRDRKRLEPTAPFSTTTDLQQDLKDVSHLQMIRLSQVNTYLSHPNKYFHKTGICMQIQASKNLACNRNQKAHKCNIPRDIYTVP